MDWAGDNLASLRKSGITGNDRLVAATGHTRSVEKLQIVLLYDKRTSSTAFEYFMKKSIAVRTLYGQVMNELGQRIISGQVKPGEVLPREDVLAASLRISRNALREVLKVLSTKGLVESRTGVGARVLDQRHWHQLDPDVLRWRCAYLPSDDFIDNLMEMREIIEPAVAAMAARRRTATQLAHIEEACNAMAAAETPDAWTQADLTFHDAVLQTTGNELIKSLSSVIETALDAVSVLTAPTEGNLKHLLPHHRKVLDAIRHQQPDVARKAMQAIITHSHEDMQRRRTDARPRHH